MEVAPGDPSLHHPWRGCAAIMQTSSMSASIGTVVQSMRGNGGCVRKLVCGRIRKVSGVDKVNAGPRWDGKVPPTSSRGVHITTPLCLFCLYVR
jgi:hypothetical protein